MSQPSRFTVEVRGIELKPEDSKAIQNHITKHVLERVQGAKELPDFSWWGSFYSFLSYGGPGGGPYPVREVQE